MPVIDPSRAAERATELQGENTAERAGELEVLKAKRREELREQADAERARQQKAEADARTRFNAAVQAVLNRAGGGFPLWRYRLDDVANPTGNGPHLIAFALPGHNEVALKVAGNTFAPLGWVLAAEPDGAVFSTFADVLIAAEK